MPRILYFDIDSLRPDHLGCYGYPRTTSPNIDKLAQESLQLTNCYCSDSPCLPSRTALFSGRFGVHNGIVDHGGPRSEMFSEGDERRFSSRLGKTSFMAQLRKTGMHTASISSFGERHSAWHWYAGFSEVHNSGKRGMDIVDDVEPLLHKWLDDQRENDNWFLHVNFWDPHQPYRTPEHYKPDFLHEPTPDWLTEEVRAAHWKSYGPQSAQELIDYGHNQARFEATYPRQPHIIDSMDAVKRMFDGYDTAVRYVDDAVGRVIETLAAQGILDDTVIIISADHGENLGEQNVYGGHRLADYGTTHIPMIIRWPGVTDSGNVTDAFHYNVDMAATVLDMVGAEVPDNWDGESFAGGLKSGSVSGRDYVVVSQGAVAAQRGVRFGDYMLIRSYHDGHQDMTPIALYNIADDPHETVNLADSQPEVVAQGLALLEQWLTQMMLTGEGHDDPMWAVIAQGGGYHARGELPAYLERLEATGRGDLVAGLREKYAAELGE